LCKSRDSRKYNNLSAEFEALMGKKFKFGFILITCALPTKEIASSGMGIGEG